LKKIIVKVPQINFSDLQQHLGSHLRPVFDASQLHWGYITVTLQTIKYLVNVDNPIDTKRQKD